MTDRPADDRPDGAWSRYLRYEAAGCLTGAFLMSLFAIVILLFASRQPGAYLQLLVGAPVALASVPAWGVALLLHARATGNRRTRVAAYVLLAIGALFLAAFLAVFFARA